MKRDLKINYGILDGIIEQLHTYKNALDTMHSSLETLVGFIRNNYAESIDAWDDLVKDSKKHIKDYQTQIGDLLSLFEGYVDDTTAYISPIARNLMMRVDRNDIWANLCQVESGITNNVPKALSQANRVPSDLFNWDDPTDEEKASSRANKAKMEYIQAEIQTTNNILNKKMDSLWNLYDNKIVPFENTDDAYNDKAADVKDKYTDFFEAVADALSGIGNAVASFVEGLVDGIVDIVVGLVTIIIEAGIVAISNQIPDFVEPDILKDKANEIKDKYGEMVVNAVEDPFSILESLGQGVTDTAEEEGIMYIAGNVSTSFIPYVGVLGKAKWLKAVDNGNGPKTKPVSDGIQAKVKDLVNNNKAFEGIKNGAIEFVSGVRNGANIFFNGVLRPNSINDRLAPAGVPSGINVPWNVLDNKIIQDNIIGPLKMLFGNENGGGNVNKDIHNGTGKVYPTRQIDSVEEAYIINRVKELRGNLPSKYKTGGNFALAEVNIDGLNIKEFYASSKIDELKGSLIERASDISLKPNDPVFKATEAPNAVGESYLRDSDTEYKILNDIAIRLGDNTEVTGKIKLFTELDTCNSCSRVIAEFANKYRNIDLEIIHNNGERIKP
ncbi:deaminase domain-containing protein [Metabacillus niabensis]|uniref:deaminase domain-containing protein n=1 Tax=Metabacillus niabensis TaxID=324854 RepID=UPI0039A11395